MDNLYRDIDFVMTIDKMKSIERMTKISDDSRRENDAEHSWHIAAMAMVFAEYADSDIDINRVIKMLIIHDLVEIYAGDTFAYDKVGYADKAQRETESAAKLFDELGEKGEYMKKLWKEFDAVKTDDAVFANCIDRIQPMLLNLANGGGTWVSHNVHFSDVVKRMIPIKLASARLYKYIYEKVESFYAENGLEM